MQPHNILRGILFMCAASAIFPIMNAMVKHLSAELPTAEIVWARNLSHFIFVTLIFALSCFLWISRVFSVPCSVCFFEPIAVRSRSYCSISAFSLSISAAWEEICERSSSADCPDAKNGIAMRQIATTNAAGTRCISKERYGN